MSATSKKPVPLPDELSRPFWDAAKERRLVIQRCSSCGHYNHPPRRFCDACLAQDLRFEPIISYDACENSSILRGSQAAKAQWRPDIG
jgi:hypothetical protein